MKWLELQESPKEYLSYSQIFLWQKCRQAYFYRYIQDIRTPLPARVILGLSYHHAMSAAYKTKARDRWYRDISLDAFATDYDSAKTRVEINWDEPKDAVRKQGLSLVDAYGTLIAPTVPITDDARVERRVECEIGGVKVVGYADLISDQRVIIDHKTSTRRKKSEELTDDIQTTIYEYAAVKDGIAVTGREWHAAIRLKAPVVEVITATSAQAGFETLEQVVAGINLDMRTGNFYPSGFPKNCSWCDYKNRGCEAWKGRVSVTVPKEEADT